MLTKEANERLTQVGIGTPMGALLRRYWHPVATLPELLSEPVLAVTVLGGFRCSAVVFPLRTTGAVSIVLVVEAQSWQRFFRG